MAGEEPVEKERFIRIVEDAEKGPMVSYSGFKYLAEVIVLLGIAQEIMQQQIQRNMKQNMGPRLVQPPFGFPPPGKVN